MFKMKAELLGHVIDRIQDLNLDDAEDLHYHCFNEDYYIVGYYQANEWLKQYDIDAWEAIADVIGWEQGELGEVYLKPEDINSEKIVNMYVYIKGQELLSDYDLDQDIQDLLEEMKTDFADLVN